MVRPPAQHREPAARRRQRDEREQGEQHELTRTAPAYAGLTQRVLHSDVAHDGILVPLTGNEDHRDDVSPIDPVALPGVESVERQGAPPR